MPRTWPAAVWITVETFGFAVATWHGSVGWQCFFGVAIALDVFALTRLQ